MTEEEATARAESSHARTRRRAIRREAGPQLELIARLLPATGEPILRYVAALNREARANRDLAALYRRMLDERTEAAR